MLKAGYNVKVSAGAITAGGCLGILIPPSVLLIVYGAVAGVSVVQLYAGAFFPGFMLAGLYVGYVVLLAWWKPNLMPPLAESEQRVAVPGFARALAQHGSNALVVLWRAATGGHAGVAKRTVLMQLFVTLVPALFIVAMLEVTYRIATAPAVEASTAGLASPQRRSRRAKSHRASLAHPRPSRNRQRLQERRVSARLRMQQRRKRNPRQRRPLPSRGACRCHRGYGWYSPWVLARSC
jgi:hypothetical protein